MYFPGIYLPVGGPYSGRRPLLPPGPCVRGRGRSCGWPPKRSGDRPIDQSIHNQGSLRRQPHRYHIPLQPATMDHRTSKSVCPPPRSAGTVTVPEHFRPWKPSHKISGSSHTDIRPHRPQPTRLTIQSRTLHAIHGTICLFADHPAGPRGIRPGPSTRMPDLANEGPEGSYVPTYLGIPSIDIP